MAERPPPGLRIGICIHSNKTNYADSETGRRFHRLRTSVGKEILCDCVACYHSGADYRIRSVDGVCVVQGKDEEDTCPAYDGTLTDEQFAEELRGIERGVEGDSSLVPIIRRILHDQLDPNLHSYIMG